VSIARSARVGLVLCEEHADLMFEIWGYTFYRGDVADVSFCEVVHECHLPE
jgi:hypothetical protein